MPLNVSPVTTHPSESYHPPGVSGDDWGYLVSSESLLHLTLFLTENPSVGNAADIRTPALGSQVTYIAVSSAQRDAALAAGAAPAPSEGKCRRNAFDWSSSVTGWEP